MPCDSLAVATARVEPNVGTELLANPDGLRALALGLVKILAIQPEVVLPVEGRAEAYLRTPRVTLCIRPTGITATSGTLSRSETDRIATAAAQIGTSLAVPLATERTVKTLAQRYGKYAIQSDTRVGQTRVVKIRIPL